MTPGDSEDCEVLQEGTAENRRFRVVQVRGKHFAGYVRTNFGPLWSYDGIRGYMGGLVEAHGGLTYGVDDEGWVGFDYAHSGDSCVLDGEEQTDYGHTKDWGDKYTPEDVAAECRKVARQVDTLETFAEGFEDRGWGLDYE